MENHHIDEVTVGGIAGAGPRPREMLRVVSGRAIGRTNLLTKAKAHISVNGCGKSVREFPKGKGRKV